ncbi:MAG: RluA family pseudouridine synthase [Candidatus Binatia bacterium]
MLVRLAIVDQEQIGVRLDLFLASYSPKMGGVSRSEFQKMISGGVVTVNGRRTRPSTRLKSEDLVEIQWQPVKDTGLMPEPLPLDILYEDEDCLVVNKAPGMVVHPAGGRRQGTLVNALLHHCPNLPGIKGEKRPGIVHRLDKDTSGAMVVAKNGEAFRRLAVQFKDRRVSKEYLALVWGKFDGKWGIIDRRIGRHRRDRKRMSSLYTLPHSREAVTEWQVEHCFEVGSQGSYLSRVTLLRLKPQTGRTHQIRVHLADQGYPVVGDRIYGWKQRILAKHSVDVPALKQFSRQALHAEKLSFNHPRTGVRLEFQAPVYQDMQRLLDCLRERDVTGFLRKEEKGA